MNNKKLVIGIFTVFFIGVTGLIYSLGAVKEPEGNVIFSNDAEQNSAEMEPMKKDTEQSSTDAEYGENEDAERNRGFIYVHLCGEVVKPDVYEIQAETRLIELVKLAGGFTKKAAKDAVNLAQLLSDGQKVYIPSKEEMKKGTSVNQNDVDALNGADNLSKETAGLVNINKASKEQLMTLPGIGEAKANSIITYRSTNGSYRTIEDIKNIEGIKDGVFQKIRDLITID